MIASGVKGIVNGVETIKGGAKLVQLQTVGTYQPVVLLVDGAGIATSTTSVLQVGIASNAMLGNIQNAVTGGSLSSNSDDSLSVREKLLNSVSNEKLKNCINEIYRPGATVGDGGLADAIRNEITNGNFVGGKSHIQKGIERCKKLENILINQQLNSTDIEIATKLLNDLKNALALGGY